MNRKMNLMMVFISSLMLDLHVDLELPTVDLDLILQDFKWSASGDAAALEASLISELQALEAVWICSYQGKCS